MKGTRIAIIDHVGLKAGMECYDQELYFGLKAVGCLPVVYSNFPSPSEREAIFPVFRFRIKENIFSVLKMLQIYGALKVEIEKKKMEYVILHGFRFGVIEWMMLRTLKKSSAKIFLIVHDPGSLIGRSPSLKWKKKIVKACEKLIVHNNFCFEKLAREFPDEERNKLVIIPHGNFIDSAVYKTDAKKLREEFNLAHNRKYLLFFGQIKETKGLDLLLDALTMTDTSTELIVAGRMRRHSFSKYQTLIDKYKLNSRVKLFIQYISPAMRNSLFQIADAVVLPYRMVYQSGVMLMAMSYGKAVIASDLPPNKEIISHEQNGFLFASGSKEKLAEAINSAMRNDMKREKVALAGFNYVNEKHNWNKIAQQWIKLFNS